jgi:Fic family protein
MAGITHYLPEPLQTFRRLATVLAAELRDVEAAYATFRKESEAGRILANSVEALRVELTYHSNAIEGSTLSLRETQLVLEGFAPPGGKTLREVYEARNHDRALRMMEQ